MLDSSGLGVNNNPLGVCKTKNTPWCTAHSYSSMQHSPPLKPFTASIGSIFQWIQIHSMVSSSCPSSPASCLWIPACTFNVPSYGNWFNFCLLNKIHSYCLFEPHSCNCVRYRIILSVPQCLPTPPSLLQNQFLPLEGQQFLDLTAAFEALLQLCVELKESLLAFDIYSPDGASS